MPVFNEDFGLHFGGHLNTFRTHERRGDKRFPRDLEKFDNADLSELGIQPLIELGQTKEVPHSEFQTLRRIRIAENRLYFNQNPPTTILDIEDPHHEMTRFIHPISREVITKGSKFLFGKQRWMGVESFTFGNTNARFNDQWRNFWFENKMDSLLPRIARTTLYAGDCFLKFGAETIVETRLSVPDDMEDGDMVSLVEQREKKMTRAFVTVLDPMNIHAITERDRADNILVWVHQFQRPDSTFFREEIFRDMTLVYEGRIKERDEKDKNRKERKLAIPGSGFHRAEIHVEDELIEYTLVKIIDYAEFDEFPIVPFINDPDNELYGTSVYHGLHGKFDSLNAIFTRSLHAIENQATPLLWIKGASESTGHDVHTPDAIWYFQNENADVNVLQWDGTPKAVFEFIDRIEKQIFRIVGVPKSSDMEAFTNVSGEALQAINTDIIDTTCERRVYYEESFRRLARLVRKAFDHPKPIEDSMIVKWGSVFPESPNNISEHLLALKRENIIASEYVIEEDPFIPFFKKEELKKVASKKEKEEAKLKQQAIDAQSKRVSQRTVGQTPERGQGKSTRSDTKPAAPNQPK